MRLIALAMFVFFLSSGNAQEVELSAKLESTTFKIGEWIDVKVAGKMSHAVKSIVPAVVDSIGPFEVLSITNEKESVSEGFTHQSWEFRLTTFDTGRVFIPAIPFTYTLEKDSIKREAFTNSLFLTVEGVTVNLQEDFKDIKPPLDAPWLFEDFLPFLLALAIIGLMILAYVYYKRKKRKIIAPEILERRIPPHERALSALRELEERTLWQQGMVKEYYSEVTEIIRRYIEDCFDVPALERTSDEILFEMKEVDDPRINRNELSAFLLTADLVKFAKYLPSIEENVKELQTAYSFVRATASPLSTVEPIEEREMSNVG